MVIEILSQHSHTIVRGWTPSGVLGYDSLPQKKKFRDDTTDPVASALKVTLGHFKVTVFQKRTVPQRMDLYGMHLPLSVLIQPQYLRNALTSGLID